MKLIKMLLLLQFLVIIFFNFTACKYESSVMTTLPEYSDCDKYSYGTRDYIDYYKYYYTSNDDILESIENNKSFQKVTNDNIDDINKCIKYFNSRINNSTDDLRDNYDFLTSQIKDDDYFCFIFSDKSNPFNDFDLYYFDKETQILYYFHSDV